MVEGFDIQWSLIRSKFRFYIIGICQERGCNRCKIRIHSVRYVFVVNNQSIDIAVHVLVSQIATKCL